MGVIAQTNLMTSDISSGQSGPHGCVITGSVYFNIARYDFAGGSASFLLRNAEVVARVTNGGIDAPAYRLRANEGFEGKSIEKFADHSTAKSKKAVGGKLQANSRKLSAEASVSAEASESQERERGKTTRLTESASGERIVFTYDRSGGRWMISGRPTKLKGRLVECLFGEHFQAGDRAGGRLVSIVATRPDWRIELSLSFAAQDVIWWEFDCGPLRFVALARVFSKKTDARGFLSKMAIAKWLAKRSDQEPFFTHETGAAHQ